MKILARTSYRRAAKKLTASERAEVNAAIARIPELFGYPHQHEGLGLRRLEKRTYEIRAGLDRRVVFLLESGDVVLATVGDHGSTATELVWRLHY